MTTELLLEQVKLACRIFNDSFDSELTDLISAAFYDLEISGVANTEGIPYSVETVDQLVATAVKTYCKLHFGDLLTDFQWQKLKESYDEQKAQLKMRNHSDAGLEPGPGPEPVPVGTYVRSDEMFSISDEDIDEAWNNAG